MFKSFLHWKVFLNIIIAIGVFYGLIMGTFAWLKHHTNHGKEVPVPNVVDMPVQEAVKVLEDMVLTVEVDSFKYEPKYKPFQVLQIYPSAGARVKDGRTIILKVNPKTWAKIEVPDVLDKYKGLAFSRLELVGLKVGDTIYEPNIQKDAVIRMIHKGNELKPGTLLPKFSVIDLVVGSGPLRNISIPNLVGLTVGEAKKLIKASNFEIGMIDYEGSDKGDDKIVYYQDPAYGSLRDQGMQIDIWAGKKTPAEMYEKVKELNKIYRRNEVEEFDFDAEFSNSSIDAPKKEKPKPQKENNPISSQEKKPAEDKVPVEQKPTKPVPEKPKKANHVVVE